MSQGMGRGLLLLSCVVAITAATPRRAARPAPPSAPRAKRFDAPLGRPPLTPPLVVTGGFGEYRVGHFHAGYDFGTGKKVGKPVFAPLSGHVERIRASGVGYGRSIYLRTRDGRLLQFGHLDAFAEPMASWVRAKQDSDGVYEQDLWPEASRFPIKLGERIAWTGESGAGGPHMHFEIRRGDMAYQPELAGLSVKDERAPTLASLTLEPLDDTSYVEGSAGPVTRRLGAKAETLRVIGRVRAIVGARDGVWTGVDRMVPWLTRMEWGNQWIECRMDSISWATDMSEGDYVYDAGRVIGEKGIVLWASRGFRPRFIRSSAPLPQEAGTITVRRGDAPLKVMLEARDVAGHVARKTVVVSPGLGVDSTRTFAVKNPRTGDDRFELAALPSGYVRVDYRGAVATRRAWIESENSSTPRPATFGANGWTVVLRPRAGGGPGRLRAWESGGRDDRGPMFYALKDPVSPGTAFDQPTKWLFPASARFDSCSYISWEGLSGFPSPGSELVALKGPPTNTYPAHLGPENEPLRESIRLLFFSSSSDPHLGIYRHDDDGWSWVGDSRSQGHFDIRSSRLGWFAEFQDTLGPRIALRTPARTAAPGPYNRWGIEAGITEQGSGLNARACYFVVDGKKVAVEWDPEADALRWRPLKRPASGTHKYDVIAEDRAGNQSIRSGTFVLD